MHVFITVDVEIWCNGWDNLDREFPAAFRRYVYGRTANGDFALPWVLRVLSDHRLKASFFTEALFAGRFGIAPLEEIIGLIRQHDQDVQLHLHTEWADEFDSPSLQKPPVKCQYLRELNEEEQAGVIGFAKSLLVQAGAESPVAFRAGGFGLSAETLPALARNGIAIDSSYNACMGGTLSGIGGSLAQTQPFWVNGVLEYPMSYFVDGLGRRRHAQVGACSFAELRDALQQAYECEWGSFVLLLHNTEGLDQSKRRQDRIVVRRFEKLCAYLAQHKSMFDVVPMNQPHALYPPFPESAIEPALGVQPSSSYLRWAEQALRRIVS